MPPLCSASPKLLVVGASARAAAFSALRAGLRPQAVDLFADADLAGVCPAARVEGYPQGFLGHVASADCDGWLYTGGLECYPALVERMARHLPLWGNSADALRRVRDPFQVAAALQAAGLAVPETARCGDDLPRDGSWLRKRLRSSGGGHVIPWTAAARRGRGHYFQRRVEGLPCSAVYVAAAGRAVLLGITEQLVGAAWCRAAGFRYAGSIGPLQPAAGVRGQFVAVGNRLAAAFSLTGLFGVDAVLSGQTVWPVEVNPRYTASIEVLERALGQAFLTWHLAACRDAALPEHLVAQSSTVEAKAVLYAARPLRVDAALAGALLAESRAPDPLAGPLADVPAEGTEIAAGRPVLTVFARGATRRQARQRLRAAVQSYQRRLA